MNARTIAVWTCALLCCASGALRAQWVRTNGPYFNPNITCLAVGSDGVGGKTLFAGTQGDGVFLSTDKGANWTAVNTGLPSKFIDALLAVGNTVYAGGNGGVFASTDNGAHWSVVSKGLTSTVRSLAASDDGAGGTKLYAGLDYGGAYGSAASGGTWTALNTAWGGTSVYALAVVPDGSGSSMLFAAPWDQGVAVSTDNGGHWGPVNAGLGNMQIHALAFSPRPGGGTSLFAGTSRGGIWRSTDHGTTWTQAGLPKRTVLSFAVRPLTTGGSEIYAGCEDAGVFRSSDDGATWTPTGTGLPKGSVQALAALPDDAGATRIFAGMDAGNYGGFFGGGGVYFSDDSGANWQPANDGLRNTSITALAVGADIVLPGGRSGTNLVAGTTRKSGCFHSADNGESWAADTAGLANAAINALLFNVTNVFAAANKGPFLSTDFGKTWTLRWPYMWNGEFRTLAVNGSTLYAGDADGVNWSTNGGTSWKGKYLTTNSPVEALVFSGTRLFAGSLGSGIYLSTDYGETWKAANAGLSKYRVRCLATGSDGAGGSTLYAGTDSGGVFVSSNAGASWTASGLTNATVASLAATPNTTGGTVVFAGIEGGDGGVFVSTDNGVNWTAASTGLGNTSVHVLAVTPEWSGMKYLYAGTTGNGVWRRAVSDMLITDVRSPTNHPAAATPELSVQPNPARDQVLVRYHARGETGTLELFNVHGARVLGAEAHASGIARFDVSQFPAGMYLLLLRSGADVVARRVMVVR